jgi:hypothetical protein
MRRRRRGPGPPPEAVEAFAGFRATLVAVEEARATLMLGVPSGRSPRLPLAEALFGFERGLAEARDRMAGWRGPASAAPEVLEAWDGCEAALREAGRRAERLRVEAGPGGYEELVPLLEDLLDPLGAFEAAAGRFRSLGL